MIPQAPQPLLSPIIWWFHIFFSWCFTKSTFFVCVHSSYVLTQYSSDLLSENYSPVSDTFVWCASKHIILTQDNQCFISKALPINPKTQPVNVSSPLPFILALKHCNPTYVSVLSVAMTKHRPKNWFVWPSFTFQVNTKCFSLPSRLTSPCMYCIRNNWQFG